MTSDFLKSTGEKYYTKLGAHVIKIAYSICTNKNNYLYSMTYNGSHPYRTLVFLKKHCKYI